MQELKKSLDRKCTPKTIPESLDGKVTEDSILERFRECYENLFNSAGTEDAMVNIKFKMLFYRSDLSCRASKVTTSQTGRTTSLISDPRRFLSRRALFTE